MSLRNIGIRMIEIKMKKLLLLLPLLIIQSYNSQEKKYTFDYQVEYLENEKNKITIYTSKENENILLISSNGEEKLYFGKDCFNVKIINNKIDYNNSNKVISRGAVLLKITNTGEYIKIGKYRTTKIIFEISGLGIKIETFVDEKSKIDNISFLKKFYETDNPNNFPKGLFVKADLVWNIYGPNKKDYWNLKNVNNKEKRVLLIDTNEILKLRFNRDEQFNKIKVIHN